MRALHACALFITTVVTLLNTGVHADETASITYHDTDLSSKVCEGFDYNHNQCLQLSCCVWNATYGECEGRQVEAHPIACSVPRANSAVTKFERPRILAETSDGSDGGFNGSEVGGLDTNAGSDIDGGSDTEGGLDTELWVPSEAPTSAPTSAPTLAPTSAPTSAPTDVIIVTNPLAPVFADNDDDDDDAYTTVPIVLITTALVVILLFASIIALWRCCTLRRSYDGASHDPLMPRIQKPAGEAYGSV